jgi:hypothetical protein
LSVKFSVKDILQDGIIEDDRLLHDE